MIERSMRMAVWHQDPVVYFMYGQLVRSCW